VKLTSVVRFISWALVLPAMLAACGTTPAPDYGGRWRAVNRFSETTEAIPLHKSYVFQAAPMDGTLKKMLERWAKDSNMTLSYLHPSDFTLHAPVASVHTSNVNDAMSQLNAIYSAQQVSVAAEGNQIVVRYAEPAAVPAQGGSEPSTSSD
jgi:hypothetical protein